MNATLPCPHAALLAIFALGCHAAMAQTVADPTRPPAAFSAAASGINTAAGPRAAASAPVPAALQLQSLQVPRNGPPSALLDGRMVRVGERVGALTVSAIDAQGLTLRGPRGEQRLSLLNGVLKTASGSVPLQDNPRTLAAGAMKETR